MSAGWPPAYKGKTPVFGVVLIDKPCGLSSHDVVSRVRRIFGLRQVGHLGTLDPEAEGVLPVCLGTATRLIEYFPSDKRYQALVRLGQETFTLDRAGELLKDEPLAAAPNDDALQAALALWTGVIQQRVPRHSAVHYKGKKLYHYAHDGIVIPEEELPVKEVTIHQLTASAWNPTLPYPSFELHVHASSGTYIRSLVRDVAASLGTVGTMMALRRVQHGLFHERHCQTLEALAALATPCEALLNPCDFLPQPALCLDSLESSTAFRHGMPIEADALRSLQNDGSLEGLLHNNALFQVFAPATEAEPPTFLGMAMWHNERLRPKKVLLPHVQ